MTDKLISNLISVLRYSKSIYSLRKNILDTCNILHTSAFDKETACKQIVSNSFNHPEVFAVIQVLPCIVRKSFNELTREDLFFYPNRHLEGLAAKEMGA